ncbi:MAG: MarR family transcriptional regulator [Pseudomonadota bacterium]
MVEDIVRAMRHLMLGTRLKRIGERLQSDTQTLIHGAGISIPTAQFPLLVALHRFGPLNIGDLAGSLGISQPGVTRMVRLLEASGLIRTAPLPEDQRIKTVALTFEGEEMVTRSMEVLWPNVEAAVVDACAGFSESLLEQLGKLEDALDEASLAKRAQHTGKDRT